MKEEARWRIWGQKEKSFVAREKFVQDCPRPPTGRPKPGSAFWKG